LWAQEEIDFVLPEFSGDTGMRVFLFLLWLVPMVGVTAEHSSKLPPVKDFDVENISQWKLGFNACAYTKMAEDMFLKANRVRSLDPGMADDLDYQGGVWAKGSNFFKEHALKVSVMDGGSDEGFAYKAGYKTRGCF
jgi:hypothetical protein